mmetsp:Transcript_3499/g.13569  ORF Transcript_3499/g.13569 Transcript_3499/m.13569 type:complete len:220 (-) Transcript_3499:1656-2315(-)
MHGRRVALRDGRDAAVVAPAARPGDSERVLLRRRADPRNARRGQLPRRLAARSQGVLRARAALLSRAREVVDRLRRTVRVAHRGLAGEAAPRAAAARGEHLRRCRDVRRAARNRVRWVRDRPGLARGPRRAELEALRVQNAQRHGDADRPAHGAAGLGRCHGHRRGPRPDVEVGRAAGPRSGVGVMRVPEYPYLWGERVRGAYCATPPCQRSSKSTTKS